MLLMWKTLGVREMNPWMSPSNSYAGPSAPKEMALCFDFSFSGTLRSQSLLFKILCIWCSIVSPNTLIFSLPPHHPSHIWSAWLSGLCKVCHTEKRNLSFIYCWEERLQGSLIQKKNNNHFLHTACSDKRKSSIWTETFRHSLNKNQK